jgi:hypothetical protein
MKRGGGVVAIRDLEFQAGQVSLFSLAEKGDDHDAWFGISDQGSDHCQEQNDHGSSSESVRQPTSIFNNGCECRIWTWTMNFEPTLLLSKTRMDIDNSKNT